MRKVVGMIVLMCVFGLQNGCEISDEPIPGATSKRNQQTGPPAHAANARGNLRFEKTFDEGARLAVETNRPMLLFFTAEWCHFCHQLAQEAFTDAEVTLLSQRFVCVMIDADSQPEICRKFHVQSFPTIQFVTPGGHVLSRVTGKRPGPEIVQAMQQALQSAARMAQQSSPTLY
ncbi:MAG: protein disulfide isomerase family protein [Planctomycetota bacterium]|nr:protein disulfide isomerase family protein [Planctomycetota bacterium]